MVVSSASPPPNLQRRPRVRPLQLLAVYEGTGEGSVAHLRAFGHKLHTHGLHLLGEVEVFEVFHAFGVKHVAEVTQSLDVDALALSHAGVHHARYVAQYGLHVRVTYCGDLRQITGDGFRFHRLSLHDDLGIVNALFLLKCFFSKWHNLFVLSLNL